MGGSDMDYRSRGGKNNSNIALLVERLTASNHEDENICNNNNFEVEYILRPVAETTLKEFIDTCVRNVSNFPEDWTLCTKDGSFNCGPVTDYVSACAAERTRKCDMDPGPPSDPCTMGMVMSQSSGLLILFVLVLIGMLIATTLKMNMMRSTRQVAAYYRRWANKKVRGKHYAEKGKTQPSSVFHLETLDSQNTGGSSGPYETDFTHQYIDNQSPRTSNEDDDNNEYAYIGAGGVRISGSQSIQDYEGLRRNNSQQQSHKYAYLPQTVPDESLPPSVPEENDANEVNADEEPSQDYTHNYFVLEKNQNH